MYEVKRISTEPGSPIKIMVDQDGGLAIGGSFQFYPAGSDDGPSAHSMNERTARAIMGDPGIAEHFTCTPALPGAEIDQAAVQETKPTRRRGSRDDITEA